MTFALVWFVTQSTWQFVATNGIGDGVGLPEADLLLPPLHAAESAVAAQSAPAKRSHELRSRFAITDCIRALLAEREGSPFPNDRHRSIPRKGRGAGGIAPYAVEGSGAAGADEGADRAVGLVEREE